MKGRITKQTKIVLDAMRYHAKCMAIKAANHRKSAESSQQAAEALDSAKHELEVEIDRVEERLKQA